MENIAGKMKTEKEIELLSLDDFVKKDSKNILYARIRGERMIDAGIVEGDLVVADCDKQPTTSDIVLMEVGDIYMVKSYSEVKGFVSPMRLVARNGKAVKSKTTESVKIVGVVTHILKSLGGSK